jgi:hypothetical protein
VCGKLYCNTLLNREFHKRVQNLSHVNFRENELPTAQQTTTVVDPKATRRKHHYYINNHNHRTDRTSTLQNYWETVQKCEFQLNYK